MTNTNLRPEAGGNPARSNSTGLRNDPKAARDGNDFPDAPSADVDPTPQDQPDLDAFAARLGTDSIETGDGLAAVADHCSAHDATTAWKFSAAAALVAGLIGLVVWRRRRRSPLTRIVDTVTDLR